MAERANSFDDLDDLGDLSEFTPKALPAVPNREEVRAVAERGDFVSREPKKRAQTKQQRRYRTGRTVQIPCRVTQAVMNDIHALTDAAPEGMRVMGLTIERAIAALKRELAGQG
jgi:hypothetical protein